MAQSGTDHPLFEGLPEHVSGEPSKYESPDTTHYSIFDTEGNVVSNTYTLNDSYGSGVTAKGTGILLNNELDDFTSKVGVANDYGLIQGESNAIAPKKRPLSSMTPSILVTDNKPFMVIGSPAARPSSTPCRRRSSTSSTST